MNKSIFDQLDTKRQRILKAISVFWTVWFGVLILNELVKRGSFTIDLALALVGAISFVFLLLFFLKYVRLSSKIKNSRFKEALNNELYRIYRSKSLSWGFWSVMCTVIVFLILSAFLEMSVALVCQIILYIGVLSSLISGLIYNRQTHDN